MTGGFDPGRSPMVQSWAVVLPHPGRKIPQVLSPLTMDCLSMMYMMGGCKGIILILRYLINHL